MNKQPDPQPASRAVCHKLECMSELLAFYSRSCKSRDCTYLELFAQFNDYTCKETGAEVTGISRRALSLGTAFKRFIFSSSSQPKPGIEKSGYDILVIKDSIIKTATLKRIFDYIPRSSDILCIIDPPGYRRLRWTTMKKMISSGTNWQGLKMDIVLFIPMLNTLLQNLTRPDCAASIKRFFGNNRWLTVRDEVIAGQIDSSQAGDELVDIYCSSLKKLGYRHVDIINPTPKGRLPAYYVIWASDRENLRKIIGQIWCKTRFLPGEIFYPQP